MFDTLSPREREIRARRPSNLTRAKKRPVTRHPSSSAPSRPTARTFYYNSRPHIVELATRLAGEAAVRSMKKVAICGLLPFGLVASHVTFGGSLTSARKCSDEYRERLRHEVKKRKFRICFTRRGSVPFNSHNRTPGVPNHHLSWCRRPQPHLGAYFGRSFLCPGEPIDG